MELSRVACERRDAVALLWCLLTHYKEHGQRAVVVECFGLG